MKLKRTMIFAHPGVFTRTTSGSDFEWRLSARLLQAPDDCDGSPFFQGNLVQGGAQGGNLVGVAADVAQT